ncbi:MAG: RNB domain-containing ribonuclease [Bacteroidaceae bacterium]|nr:RNB domain-containing ribonuclease [Bacteroidaceae bacterium]
MSKKKGLTKSHINKRELTQMVIDLLQKNAGKKYSMKSVFQKLGMSSHPERMLCVDVLNELTSCGTIEIDRNSDYYFNPVAQTAEGIFTRTSGGRNFVDTDDGVGIAIYDENTLHALPGDRVKVSLLAKRRGSDKLHGEVIEILKRSERPIVGTLQIQHDTAFLVNPTSILPGDILIPTRFLKGGVNGDKVVVKVNEWPAKSHNPIGEVIEVLGKGGEHETEMHAILAEYGLPYSYPKDVEDAANLIDADITQTEIAKREDFRDTLTMTIDPRDAKDFDDAISIKDISQKYSHSDHSKVWEIGVHIADVSHYVTQGSIIDQEAEKRATSIYLVDRTIPMLPEHLCNGICSLRPGEEKLTFSVIFDMNDDGDVLDYRIRHTLIRSNRRFTYEEVQAVLEAHGEATECEAIRRGEMKPTQPVVAQEVTVNADGKCLCSDGTVQPDAEQFATELIQLNRFAKILRSRRFKEGAIDFDREEVRFEIDKDGKPLSIYFKRAKDANKLVEEFMLLANRTVAESVGKVEKGKKAKVLPYRIHDLPDPGKLENLAQMASRLGYSLVTQGNKVEVAKSLNRLLEGVKGKKWENLVENVSLRAMQKARYSTYNIGHYGLAFDYYTHFTSPIRRYPDLMVHRLLTRYEDPEATPVSQKKYEDLCIHSSDMEQLAATAERASIKYKQVEFMADKLGEEFDAHISGVSEYGIYAEVDVNKCEGFISVRSLGNEGFNYDDQNFCLVGRQTGHRFTLGDPIRIRVAGANLFAKQLDYELVEKLSADTEEPLPAPYYMDVYKPASGGKRSKGKSPRANKKVAKAMKPKKRRRK